ASSSPVSTSPAPAPSTRPGPSAGSVASRRRSPAPSRPVPPPSWSPHRTAATSPASARRCGSSASPPWPTPSGRSARSARPSSRRGSRRAEAGVMAGTDAPGEQERREALLAALVELEHHVAEGGWDAPPRLFALVETDALAAAEPDLARAL